MFEGRRSTLKRELQPPASTALFANSAMAVGAFPAYCLPMPEDSDKPVPANSEPPTVGDQPAPANSGDGQPDPMAGFPQWVRILNLCKWPIALVSVCGMCLIAYFVALKVTKEAAGKVGQGFKQSVAEVKDAAAEIAGRFSAGYITETFTSAIPELDSEGMNLETAVMRVDETFRRTDARTALWDSVYLGTTTTEIRVPVTYRYHLDLVGPWQLDVRGQTCVVQAPAFQPTLPPAIHTQLMRKNSDRGWARFNEAEQMTELERSITPTIQRYADDVRHRRLVREECRKSVAEFVRTWLLKEDQWREDRFPHHQGHFC